ncbi:MAG: putative lipid II flippase FtsW [Candidatus Saganbacteria bacterium]|nr:putative lipid II flippase FtsW [Candidatus Saganbacteria bacterium]
MKKNADYILMFTAFSLVSIGILMIFTASPALGLSAGDPFYFLKRHVLSVMVGLGAFWMGMKINIETWRKWSWHLLGLNMFLLLLIFVPHVGVSISGARRWLDFGLFTIQPSEIAKFITVLFLADVLSNEKLKLKDFWKGFFPYLFIILAMCGLIFLEPDLGTVMIIVAITMTLFFVAGAELSHLGVLFGLGVLGIIAVSLKSAYRLKRFVAYLDPWKDPQGSGFHIIQSLLAVGSGGIFGLGLGQSKQKFFYLPQQTTDFIFAILCEETGLIGATIVVLLFLGFVLRALKIAREAPSRFYMLMATGATMWIAIQAFLNLSVVIGLLPTTGIPLPFISYGGTSIVMLLFMVGMLVRISSLGNKV